MSLIWEGVRLLVAWLGLAIVTAGCLCAVIELIKDVR